MGRGVVYDEGNFAGGFARGEREGKGGSKVVLRNSASLLALLEKTVIFEHEPPTARTIAVRAPKKGSRSHLPTNLFRVLSRGFARRKCFLS